MSAHPLQRPTAAARPRSCADRQGQAGGVALAGSFHGRRHRRAHARQDAQTRQAAAAGGHGAAGGRFGALCAAGRGQPLDRPVVMAAHPSVPAKTIAEFITYAKANPRRISMASLGSGSASHLACELFKLTAGVDLVHVPYRGGAAMITDLVGGQVQSAWRSSASFCRPPRASWSFSTRRTSASRRRTLLRTARKAIRGR